MSLRPNIKQVLGVITKALGQTPLDKQKMLGSRIERVVKKYEGQPEDTQPAYLKELEFNLNFIKLSFPKLDYTPPPMNEQEAKESEKPEEELDEERVKAEFVQLENHQQVQKFVAETEEVLKGVREEVEFVNWTAGNLDPQDLRRHKQLMARQYFAGDFWKGKEKPISPTAAYMQDLMLNHPEVRQQQVVIDDSKNEEAEFEHDPENNWEKVKR